MAVKLSWAHGNFLHKKNFQIKNATDKDNIFSMCDSDTHTLESLLVLKSLYTVLKFSSHDLREEILILTDISIHNESDLLQSNTNQTNVLPNNLLTETGPGNRKRREL